MNTEDRPGCLMSSSLLSFDPVDRHSLWLPLLSKGIQDKIVELLASPNSNTLSFVRVNGELSSWLEVSSGVCHGCVLDPDLFV